MSNSREWIQTASGRKFFPLNPDPSSIVIEDIAHALSNVCRYTGHVARFCSVAEHSVRVARRVRELHGPTCVARAVGNGVECDTIILQALLHDASEAYIADIARPVKHTDAMQPYRAIESTLQTAIYKRFSVPHREHGDVRRADLELLSTEASILMQPLHPEWIETMPGGFRPLTLEPGDFLGWSPAKAKWEFILEYVRICTDLGRVLE